MLSVSSIKDPQGRLLQQRYDAQLRQLGYRVTWYLGGLPWGTFAIQISTGLLLLLYYHPCHPSIPLA